MSARQQDLFAEPHVHFWSRWPWATPRMSFCSCGAVRDEDFGVLEGPATGADVEAWRDRELEMRVDAS